MARAIKLSRESVTEGGGPFGAVVVHAKTIIGEGKNRVTINNDPTAHAEVEAIRQACRKLKTFQLGGCTLFSSCEPCPMCFGALLWARIDTLYFASSRNDAAEAGFDDAAFYDALEATPNGMGITMHQVMQSEAAEAFRSWQAKSDRIDY